MSGGAEFEQVLRRTQHPHVEKSPASPFVKWAGGKRALIPDIARHFPERIRTYWEPFVGGGAVFFAFADRIDRAVLSDLNEELVIAYQVVKSRVDDLIEVPLAHARDHRQDSGHYLRVRKQEPKQEVEIAARFIYLNRTCYNGLYRVNKSGRFNVPKGRHSNPAICNEANLRAASKALAKATLKLGDFSKVVQPEAGDFVYCDPPYDGAFAAYQAGGFADKDQERLRNAAKDWASADAAVMLSNADTPLVRRLYGGGAPTSLFMRR